MNKTLWLVSYERQPREVELVKTTPKQLHVKPYDSYVQRFERTGETGFVGRSSTTGKLYDSKAAALRAMIDTAARSAATHARQYQEQTDLVSALTQQLEREEA
jgi:hypothetical protein